MTGQKLLVENTIKRLVKKQGLQMSSDLFNELEVKTLEMLHEGMKRAAKNNRRTLMPRDL